MSLNKAMIIGNLGRDPEMRYTPNGQAVTQFTVAVNRNYKDANGEWKEETEWFRVVAWAALAERTAEYLRKGRKVYVEGRLQTRNLGRQGRPEALHDRADRQHGDGPRSRPREDGARGAGRRQVRQGGAPSRPRRATTSAPATWTSCPSRPAGPDTDDPNRRAIARGRNELEDTNTMPMQPAREDPRRQARRLLPRSPPPQGLHVLRRQDGHDRLQGSQPAAPLPVGAGQDRAATEDRHVRQPPAPAGGRPQARPHRGAASVRPPARPAVGIAPVVTRAAPGRRSPSAGCSAAMAGGGRCPGLIAPGVSSWAIVVLILSFAVILAGSELFTNGIEWFGHKLELGEGAIGSVLAAIGTALPETMVPLIAIVFGGGVAASEIGVGAILGAPFMLATLAMFVTGAAVLLMRRRRAAGSTLAVDAAVVNHDLGYFARGLRASPSARPSCRSSSSGRAGSWPSCSSAIYGRHVWGHLQAEAAEHEGLEPLRFHRLDRGAPQHPSRPACSSSRYRSSSPWPASSAAHGRSWTQSKDLVSVDRR